MTLPQLVTERTVRGEVVYDGVGKDTFDGSLAACGRAA